MSHSPLSSNSGFSIRFDQPLIGVLVEENGEWMVRYFSEEAEADTVTSRSVSQDAIRLAGAWSDLDWEALKRGLDSIRHESPTSPTLAV